METLIPTTIISLKCDGVWQKIEHVKKKVPNFKTDHIIAYKLAQLMIISFIWNATQTSNTYTQELPKKLYEPNASDSVQTSFDLCGPR